MKRYDGTLSQFTGDGIMAVFGAPITLEDHAVRACLAALGIQEEAKRLAAGVHERDGVDLRLRVGLNSGQVIAGEIGSGSFGYTAVGEQVGMAQRMESVAPPGGVMLSASTARLVDGVAVLGEPEMVRIKGAEEPVAAHRLLGIGERHPGVGRPESTLVGRRWEMSAVEGCWTVRSMVKALWWASSGRLVSGKAVWCASFRRWHLRVVSRCSLPYASRTPARFPSTPSRGCCSKPTPSNTSRDRVDHRGFRRRWTASSPL